MIRLTDGWTGPFTIFPDSAYGEWGIIVKTWVLILTASRKLIVITF